ncbi:putative disease resistance protein RGA3-like protein [Corchorus olitorius]|uniref:Disease resistance protein RGA3-like protein n=1 Tax=Corchorus olitorius TaxID=93759 RepID=A0A1R3KKK5_9ROSI|nr:putative disease resistance protein RGA3-like protein [Corchorus olitorius]
MADFMVDIPSNAFETLADELLLETRLPWGVKSEIQKLSRNFTHVKNILIKAKEVESSHDARQGMCLRQLHDVFYDADDLLSDITAEKSKRQSLKSSSIGRKVGGEACRMI